ncbi:MAG: FkbM family methyltransferase [bacterium TMED46]|nr:MAG: FkbM family methyltransferase [bacterium TMED46]|tara:strand:- start:4427 stop:5212 length:786 start_codon:yes stop_codon:yes gene_type:complete
MNRKSIFEKYLFRKDILWKIKEKLFWFLRNNSRDIYKDQRELLKNIESGIIFDLGAHNGDTAKLYQSYFPKYKIYSFEPSPKSYDYLSSRFIDNPNINIINQAMGCKNETRKLYLSNFPNLNSLHKPNERSWGFKDEKSIDVETITLDDFCSVKKINHIDILKLDVQGSELDILKGGIKYLAAGKISLINIEWQVVPLYENHHKYYKIAEFLANYDFEFFNLYNINESRSGQLRWADAIYTSKKIRNTMIKQFGDGAGSGW